MVDQKASEELLTLPFHMEVPYKWSAGEYVSKFLIALRDEAKIICNVCPECGRGMLPPRVICGRCHVRTGEFKEVGPKGTVLLSNAFEQSFWDPTYAQQRKVPYTVALILLDGSPPCLLTHFLQETDPDKLHPEMRVEAVFKPKAQRVGHIRDILYFDKVIEG